MSTFKQKLEVYEFKLKRRDRGHTTFRNYFTEILPDVDEDSGNNPVLLEFLRFFIEAVDKDTYIKSPKTNKAFTAYDAREPGQNDPSIEPILDEELIFGDLKGGKYNRDREKSNVDKKSDLERIDKNGVIADKYYFALYTPLASDVGIIFITSYSGETISTHFKEFILKLFMKGGYLKPECSSFHSKERVEELNNNGIIDRYTFSTREKATDIIGKDFEDTNMELVVKVTIEPRISSVKSKDAQSFLEKVITSTFNRTKLNSFQKGTGSMSSSKTHAKSPFSLDSDYHLKPVIILDDEIDVNKDGEILDKDKLKAFILKVLKQEVKPDIYFN
jgi:DNA-binding Lrp family transcriptional regulator